MSQFVEFLSICLLSWFPDSLVCSLFFSSSSSIYLFLENINDNIYSFKVEDPLEKGIATHSSILAWETPWMRSLQATVHKVVKSWTGLKQLSTAARWNEDRCPASVPIFLSLLLWKHFYRVPLWRLTTSIWTLSFPDSRRNRQDESAHKVHIHN